MATMTSKDYIRQASASTPKLSRVKTNAPPQYADRQYQYTADIRAMYDAQRDYLSTDYVKAKVQGLDPSDFYKWTETYIRLSDVSTQSVTAFDSKQYDDFKEILFADREIDYVPMGAYVETMGSIWLVVNPGNMSSATTNTVIARCRTHYSFYDDYGNIVREPLVVDRRSMLSNRLESPQNIELPEGYFNVKCQLNENTLTINDNTRFILGRSAFHVTGLTDFFEEFTFDNDSVHIITFTVRREEPQVNDDMELRIADGLLYNWGGMMVGSSNLSEGNTTELIPKLTLNGEEHIPVDDDDEPLPMTWTFRSLDPSVVSVDENGIATAVGAGSCFVEATLEENPNIRPSMLMFVSAGTGAKSLRVLDYPVEITQYSSETITAALFIDGIETDYPLTWQFFGAEDQYTAKVAEDGKSATITCLSPSPEPLQFRVAYENYKAIGYIKLLGY